MADPTPSVVAVAATAYAVAPAPVLGLVTVAPLAVAATAWAVAPTPIPPRPVREIPGGVFRPSRVYEPGEKRR